MPLPQFCDVPYFLAESTQGSVIRITQTVGTIVMLFGIVLYTWKRSKPEFNRQSVEQPSRKARTNIMFSLRMHQDPSTPPPKKIFQVLPIYEKILVGGFIYCILRAVYCILILSNTVKILPIDVSATLIWSFLEGMRYWVFTFVTFLFLQRSSGALAFRRAIVLSGVLATFESSATYIAIHHEQFDELAIFDGSHVFIYFLTLWYVYDLQRNRWWVFYFYVTFFFSVYILYILLRTCSGSTWTTPTVLMKSGTYLMILGVPSCYFYYWWMTQCTGGGLGQRFQVLGQRIGT